MQSVSGTKWLKLKAVACILRDWPTGFGQKNSFEATVFSIFLRTALKTLRG